MEAGELISVIVSVPLLQCSHTTLILLQHHHRQHHHHQHHPPTMPSTTPTHFAQPLVSSVDVFRPDLFKGKVLFCTGGRGGIIYGIVEEMMKLGCDAAIFGRK